MRDRLGAEGCKLRLLYEASSKLGTYVSSLYLWLSLIFPVFRNITVICGPGSSVGIATDYGLDGPGSNPAGDEIFRPSRPDLGSIQPPIKWAPGLSRG